MIIMTGCIPPNSFQAILAARLNEIHSVKPSGKRRQIEVFLVKDGRLQSSKHASIAIYTPVCFACKSEAV